MRGKAVIPMTEELYRNRGKRLADKICGFGGVLRRALALDLAYGARAGTKESYSYGGRSPANGLPEFLPAGRNSGCSFAESI
jgi:hypothetical protein